MKSHLMLFFIFALIQYISAQSGYEEIGQASYYHDKFQGKRTANGEYYDAAELTCAHKTLKFGTLLRVTNLKSGNSVVVRVNDRGPYAHGRIIDLSRAAAVAIDLIRAGSAEVKIEEISWDEIPVAQTFPMGTDTPQDAPPILTSSGEIAVSDTEPTKGAAARANPSYIEPREIEASDYSGSEPLVTDAKKNGTYRIELREPSPAEGYIVQVAALTSLEGTLKEVVRLQKQAPHKVLIMTDADKNGAAIFKLAVGPYETKAEANNMKTKLSRKGFPKCFIVKN